MFASTTFDEIAEPQTLAAATVSLDSPLAEIAATTLPEVMRPEAHPDAIATLPVAAAPAATTLAAAPVPNTLGTLPSSTTATLPMLGALLVVVGLILALGKLVKRVQAARAPQGASLSIKGGVQIGAKERVVWMQAGDKHLLLGVSPGQVQTLHVFDTAPDFSRAAANEASPVAGVETPASKDFSERLKTLLAQARAKGLEADLTAASTADASVPMPAALSKPQFSFRA